jgi:hypothetical protein
MTTNPPKRQTPKLESSVIEWLLNSDPSIRWQVMQDLTDASADEVAAERAKVATEGFGAQLLALQGSDGSWGGVAWNRGWNSTMHVLMLLRDLGLDPESEQAKRAIGLVRDRVTWQGWETYEGNPFFAGETEPCINGQMGAAAAYFREDVRAVIDRLLDERLDDGGWNCEAENGSTRSSFNTTICVRGQEYLLERHLFRRKSTGEAINHDRKGQSDWTQFAFPTWWHYDILRGLEYFRRAGITPDERVADAIALVESKCQPDGRWLLDVRYPGEMPIEIDEGEGQPSKWNTLRALRVLKWYSAGG